MHSVPSVAASRIQSALSFLAVSLLLWSTPGFAAASGGYGLAYWSYQKPPKTWGLCETVTIPCHSASGDMLVGCYIGNVLEEARKACEDLIQRGQRERWPFWGTYDWGLYSPPPSRATGSISALKPGTYVGREPASTAEIGPTTDWSGLTEILAEKTASTSVLLKGPPEYFTWEGDAAKGAYAEVFWKESGTPHPRTDCNYTATQACSCNDGQVGDSVVACSEQGDEHASLLAKSTCSQLCYQSKSETWNVWGVLRSDAGGEESATPVATIEAVERGVFVGHLSTQLEDIGPVAGLEKLVDVLQEKTSSTSFWLAGPVEFYPSAEDGY